MNSRYEELKEKYKAIGKELAQAIKENKPWEELLNELFSCVSEMNETPEIQEQLKCLYEEADQLLKQL